MIGVLLATLALYVSPLPAVAVAPVGAGVVGPVYEGQPLSLPATTYGNVTLSALSCADSIDCVAVGSYNPPDSVYSSPLIETYRDGIWTPSTPRVPGLDGSGEAPDSATLTAVSCSSATACVAVGDEIFPPTNTVPFIQYGYAVSLSGAAWSPAVLPDQPAGNAQTGNVITLGGVSCVAAASCVAVGSYVVDESHQGGLAYSLGSNGWAPPATDVDPGTEFSLSLDAVSCPSSAACTAVGSMTVAAGGVYVQQPLAETLDSGRWDTTLQTNPPGEGNSVLSGVSCPAATTCQAVGSSTGPSGHVLALVESMDGSTWTPVSDLGQGTGSELASIACDASDGCTAVGSYASTTGAGPASHLLVETLSAAGWAITTPADPGVSTDPSLIGVSCSTQAACVGIGNASGPGGGRELFSVAEQPGTIAGLVVSLPRTGTTGQLLAGTVTAVDVAGRLARSFDGRVAIRSSDPSTVLRPVIDLTDGSGRFDLTLGRSPRTTITVADADDAAIASSSVVEVTPVPVAPSAPVGLTASGDATGVTLTWFPPTSNGGSRISGYLVYRGVAAGDERPIDLTASSTFSDHTTAGGVRYYYVVRAINDRGQSLRSNEVDTYATGDLAGGRLFAATPDGRGYWITTSAGDVDVYGDARYYGSLAGRHLNQPIVSMATTSDGGGYWLVASDGGIFGFGDAQFHGALGDVHLNQPIVGMASTRSGSGYWLVASDGGIFDFGDARFHGALGDVRLNQPIIGMAPTPDGGGYWLAASDGGIFEFGDARFHGALGDVRLNQPIVGMAPTPDGGGYWLVASDGGVFNFGGAGFYGSLAGRLIRRPILGLITSVSGQSYRLVNADGAATGFGG